MIHVCVIKGHIRGDFFCPSASCFVHPQARPSHTAQVTPPNYLIYLSTITKTSSCNHFSVAATSSNNHICLNRALPTYLGLARSHFADHKEPNLTPSIHKFTNIMPKVRNL